MLREVTIKRYGELEVVYVHIKPSKGYVWHCSVSLLHPSNTRMLDMEYVRFYDVDSIVKRYCQFLEDYWKAD